MHQDATHLSGNEGLRELLEQEQQCSSHLQEKGKETRIGNWDAAEGVNLKGLFVNMVFLIPFLSRLPQYVRLLKLEQQQRVMQGKERTGTHKLLPVMHYIV
jgi:hypothetical protein